MGNGREERRGMVIKEQKGKKEEIRSERKMWKAWREREGRSRCCVRRRDPHRILHPRQHSQRPPSSCLSPPIAPLLPLPPSSRHPLDPTGADEEEWEDVPQVIYLFIISRRRQSRLPDTPRDRNGEERVARLRSRHGGRGRPEGGREGREREVRLLMTNS